MPAKLEKVERVLIHTFDMSIAGCIDCTHEREYTILFSDPELAQKMHANCGIMPQNEKSWTI